jgi:hypothetical protein
VFPNLYLYLIPVSWRLNLYIHLPSLHFHLVFAGHLKLKTSKNFNSYFSSLNLLHYQPSPTWVNRNFFLKVAQVKIFVPIICFFLSHPSSNLSIHSIILIKKHLESKPGMVAHTYSSNNWEAEEGGPQVWAHPVIDRRPFLQTHKQKCSESDHFAFPPL